MCRASRIGLLLWLLALPGRAAADDELRLLNWDNYLAAESLQRFETQCKCRVVQELIFDNDELLARLSAGAGRYDVLVPTGNAVQALIRQRALALLDRGRLPNLKNIDPAYLDTPFDRGNRHSAPYAYTVTLIGYNEQKMRELGVPVDSWAALFDPQILARIDGKVSVLDSPRELLAAALRYLGYSANETSEARWKEARDVIVRARPYWAAFNASTYMTELASGRIWLAHGYSNDMYKARRQAKGEGRNFTVSFGVPKEGAVLALDSMVIPRDAPHPDLAHLFINFALDTATGAELSNATGSGSPNREATRHVAPDIAQDKALFPDQATLARLEMLNDLDGKQRRDLRRLWAEIRLR
jgi:spermidine/putrescine transport system substrate-binding protein